MYCCAYETYYFFSFAIAVFDGVFFGECYFRGVADEKAERVLDIK